MTHFLIRKRVSRFRQKTRKKKHFKEVETRVFVGTTKNWHKKHQKIVFRVTLQGTNISPKNCILKMIFLFPRWDMLVPWRVINYTGPNATHHFYPSSIVHHRSSSSSSSVLSSAIKGRVAKRAYSRQFPVNLPASNGDYQNKKDEKL